MSNRNLSEPDTIVRAVTVIMGAVVGLTFLFGFGNVLNLALRLGVPPWVAPLVAPAVDLTVIGLLLGTRYLAINGATIDQLRPARRLLIFSSLVTLALNVADPIIAGQLGKAAFDAVGPLLLVGWAEVGPGLVAGLAAAANSVPTRESDQQHCEINVRRVHPHGGGAVAGDTDSDLGEPVRRSPDDDLLHRARHEDLHHWRIHRLPISSDTLRKRLRISAGRSRDLVAIVRSEYGVRLDHRLASADRADRQVARTA